VRKFAGMAAAAGNTALKAGLVGIGVAATAAAVGLKKAVDEASNMEQLRTSFAVLLKDAGAANRLLKDITKFADTTSFQLPETAEAAKQLLAYGFAAQEVVPNLRMLGDVSSGLKIPIGDLIYLYGTLRAQGRAYTRDITQFTSRGIPMIDELAKVLGVSKDQVQAMVENGQVGFDQVTQAFRNMTGAGGQFAGMLDKQGRTYAGRLSTVKDSINAIFREIGTPIIEALNPALKSASDWISKEAPAAAQFGKNLVTGADAVLSIFSNPEQFSKMLSSGIELAVRSGANFLFALLRGLGSFIFASIAPAVQSIGYILLAALMRAFQIPIAYLQASVEGLTARLIAVAKGHVDDLTPGQKKRLAELNQQVPQQEEEFKKAKAERDADAAQYGKNSPVTQAAQARLELVGSQLKGNLAERVQLQDKADSLGYVDRDARFQELSKAPVKIRLPDGEFTADDLDKMAGADLKLSEGTAKDFFGSLAKPADVFGASEVQKRLQTEIDDAANSGKKLLPQNPPEKDESPWGKASPMYRSQLIGTYGSEKAAREALLAAAIKQNTTATQDNSVQVQKQTNQPRPQQPPPGDGGPPDTPSGGIQPGGFLPSPEAPIIAPGPVAPPPPGMNAGAAPQIPDTPATPPNAASRSFEKMFGSQGMGPLGTNGVDRPIGLSPGFALRNPMTGNVVGAGGIGFGTPGAHPLNQHSILRSKPISHKIHGVGWKPKQQPDYDYSHQQTTNSHLSEMRTMLTKLTGG